MHHEIDIGLIEGNYSHHQFSEEQFASDQMYIIAGEGTSLQIDGQVSIEDLEKETWIIREEGSGTRKVVEDFLDMHHIKPKRMLTFGSTQTIKEGVESGLGISLLSSLTFAKEIELGRIQKLSVDGTPIQRKSKTTMNFTQRHWMFLKTS